MAALVVVPTFMLALQILTGIIELSIVVSSLYSAVKNLLPQNWALNDAKLQASLISAITNLVVGRNATVSKQAFYKLCEEASLFSNPGLLDAPEAYGVLSTLSSINACKATWDQVVTVEKQSFFQRLIQNLPNFSIESLSKNLPNDLLPWVSWLQQSTTTATNTSPNPWSFFDYKSFFYDYPTSYVTVPVSSTFTSVPLPTNAPPTTVILAGSMWHIKLILLILLLIPLVLFSVPYLYPKIKYYLQRGYKLYNSWFLKKERVELNDFAKNQIKLQDTIKLNLEKEELLFGKQPHPYLGKLSIRTSSSSRTSRRTSSRTRSRTSSRTRSRTSRRTSSRTKSRTSSRTKSRRTLRKGTTRVRVRVNSITTSRSRRTSKNRLKRSRTRRSGNNRG